VCQCDDGIVTRLEQDFKKTLQQQNSLEQWAVWLEGVVNQVLKPHEGSSTFAKAARQFLLKWSFYRWVVIQPNALLIYLSLSIQSIVLDGLIAGM
jgi:regulatory factor X 1/2/3